MKSFYLSAAFLLFILFSGCTGDQERVFRYTKQGGQKNQEIFLDRISSDTLEIALSDLFLSFRAIPLETRKECLIQNVSFTPAGDDLLIGTQHFPGPAMLYRFDKNGKYLNTIGRGGKGPGEHSGYLQSFCRYYANDKTVLVLWAGDDPQWFRIDGTLLKTIKMPYWNLINILKWDDDEWFSLGNPAGIPHDGVDSLIMVFYREDGTITKKIPRHRYPPEGVKGYVPSGWGSSVYAYEPDWRIYVEGIDTLYTVKNKDLVPVGILHPGKGMLDYNKVTDPKYLKGKFSLGFLAETDNNLFLRKSVIKKADVKQYKPGHWGGMFDTEEVLIIIDKKTGKGAICKAKDDLYGFITGKKFSWFDWHPGGYVSYGIPVPDLQKMISDYESQQEVAPEISARLQPLKKLNEEDNPVLFLFKVKKYIEIK